MTTQNMDDLITRLKEDINEWEGQDIEFMEDFPKQAHDLAKEIAAFASSNPATIYLGVDRNRNIRGVSAIREDEAEGRDTIQNRLAGICQGNIKPAIIPRIDFIDLGNNTVVVKINITKGDEPVYYSNDIPYIRNLTISERATPQQIKELHKQYFQSTLATPDKDPKHSMLNDVLNQLSDFQILWFDHDRRQVNPDLEQMRYDLGATGRRLMQLSISTYVQELGLSDELVKLGGMLEDMEGHQFYMDGGVSWNAFIGKGNEASILNERLMERVCKNYVLHSDEIRLVKSGILLSTRELHLNWERREQYRKHGTLSTLKEVFRRLAYTFNRFANIPLQSEELCFADDLKQLARNLREASAFNYRASLGANPLEQIEPRITEAIQIAHRIIPQMWPQTS